MHYLLTPLDRHFDFGFGSVADSFRDAAESIHHASRELRGLNSHLPISFLYRHSIELYLKSTIVIFHKRFSIPYGEVSHGGEPHVLVGAKWIPLYRTHKLGDLYPYFCHLLHDHAEYLKEHTKTNWSIPPELDKWISDIEEKDSTSTFFRYPFTKYRDRDLEKSVMKRDNPSNILSRMGPGLKPQKIFLVMGKDEEITQAFFYDEDRITAEIAALRGACGLLHGCHAALRGELTDGW